MRLNSSKDQAPPRNMQRDTAIRDDSKPDFAHCSAGRCTFPGAQGDVSVRQDNASVRGDVDHPDNESFTGEAGGEGNVVAVCRTGNTIVGAVFLSATGAV